MTYLWVYQAKRIDLPNIRKDQGKQEACCKQNMNANATFYNFELRNYECESKKFERKPLLVKLVKWFKLYATTNKLSSYMK
jgi:hypothetical protein